MTAPIRIAIAGTGRMSKAVVEAIARRDDCALAGAWSRDDDLGALLAAADVLIDFTLPEATAHIAAACAAASCPLVCGVTGLGEDGDAALAAAAGKIPVLYDRNMSVGIAALSAVLPTLATALGGDYRVSINETHHVHKQDAPSGTALKLGETITGVLPGVDIEYASERRGEVPGDHEVVFRSATETIRVSHSVVTRDVFAEGAVRAALWLIGRSPSRYSMKEVLS
ncbi:MAG: dihydrodipicolinate reductase C-terminal domain-containing protein [Pseudomonadota bacterium]